VPRYEPRPSTFRTAVCNFYLLIFLEVRLLRTTNFDILPAELAGGGVT